jgi:hypothetical protein
MWMTATPSIWITQPISVAAKLRLGTFSRSDASSIRSRMSSIHSLAISPSKSLGASPAWQILEPIERTHEQLYASRSERDSRCRRHRIRRQLMLRRLSFAFRCRHLRHHNQLRFPDVKCQSTKRLSNAIDLLSFRRRPPVKTNRTCQRHSFVWP